MSPLDELRTLLLTPTGRDSSLICGVLSGDGVDCHSFESLDSLVEAIGSDYRAGLIVLAEEALDEGGADSLATHLDGEPPWSDLPLLLLVYPGSKASRLGALRRRRNTHVLHRPLQPSTLVAGVQSALEIRRHQYEVRDLLHDARGLNEQLRRRAMELRRLSLRLTDAEEQERRRLAVYVHDDLQQVLAGILFHLDVTERRLDDPVETSKALARVRELVADAIEGTRSLAHELSPAALRRSGLVAALRWLARHAKALHGLEVQVDARAEHEPAEDSVSVFLFRAAQELLLNVAKHARTSRAEISLEFDSSMLRLCVTDHGSGFEPDAAARDASDESFGLYSIRERAELLGGTVRIDSAPERGTTIMVLMPAVRAVEELAEGDVPPALEPAPSDLDAGGVRTVRVVLVDDHIVMRSGLRLVLAEHEQIKILDEYGDGAEAVEALEAAEGDEGAQQPDLILMDVAMPRMDGVEATRRIKRRHPEIRIIGLSMFNDPETSQRMLEAGAERYLSKAGPSEELISAILSPV